MTAVSSIKSDVRMLISARIAKLPASYLNKAGMCLASIVGVWLDQNKQLLFNNVALFSSMKDEISTQFIVQELDKRAINIYYPKILDGVMSFSDKLDLIFIPGRAFDKAGHRLGRGQAYYDRYLAQQNQLPLLVGLALDEQILSHVPTEEHDVSMDYVCTPNLGFFKTTKGS